MTVYLINERKGNEREFETRAEAEEQKEKLIGLGMKPENLEIQVDEIKADGPPEEEKDSDEILAEETGRPKEEFEYGGEVPDFDEQKVETKIPDEQPSVDEDPVEWMPGHFVDEIQGVPTVNRKGYAVIASQYSVSVTAEPVTLASETGFEYAEFKAVATTQDGQEYSGFGSAHVDRQDGDDEHLLNELAETRAMKRATAWATGVGMTAVEELQNKL